jgi:hypothetical protein
MVFPRTPPTFGVELFYSGAWQPVPDTDIAADGITVTYGRSAEGRDSDPASMSLRLRNQTGKYSPRNPASPLYGLAGRNTPIRWWVEHGAPWFSQDGTTTGTLSTPDSAALSITGDLDVQWDGRFEDWFTRADLVSKYAASGNRSWALQQQRDGLLALFWTADGTTLLSAFSTRRIPASTGRLAVRAALDVNNGAAGWTVTFYTAESMAGPWTQFGDPVTGAGVTSVFDSTASVVVGRNPNTTADPTGVTVYEARVYQGIAGTLRAAPKAAEEATGVASFADSAAVTWTLGTGCTVTNRHIRFTGEVVAWPQKWGRTGGPSVHAPIECAGILRRLGQGASPLRSALYRALSAAGSNLVAYWPGEDAEGATTLAAQRGGAAMRVSGAPTLATFDGFACSEPLPTLESGRLSGAVRPAYTGTGAAQVRFLARIPAATPTNTVVLRVRASGGAARWDLIYTTGGSLTLKVYSTIDAVALDTGPIGYAVDGKLLRINVHAADNGANVDFGLATLEVGAGSGLGSSVYTVTGSSVGAVTSVEFNPNLVACPDLAVGHVTVEKAITSLFDYTDELNAFTGEEATARVARLAGENGVTLYRRGVGTIVAGTGAQAQRMGPQGLDTFVSLLREAEASDAGILAETRRALALAYRCAENLYTQPATRVAYTDNLLIPFEPVEDDQGTRNVVTVTRTGGTSATVRDDTGPLGTQAPPAGVGVYDEAVSMSLATDVQAKHAAGWRVNLGTVDEARWPRVGFDLAHPAFLMGQELTRALLELDVGDRLVVTGLPAWLPPDAVDQLVQGYTETLSQTPGDDASWRVELVCAPARPYRAGLYSVTSDRYSNDSSTLTSSLTTTATSVSVTVPVPPLWTTTGGDVPFDVVVAGERMTVTAVAGATSPQTFTVTRSVNGVVKAHTAGTPVRLYDPAYFGL